MEDLIRRLYDALDRKDGEAMAACYHKDATFSDPVFTDLAGRDVGDMWRMLTSRATDLTASVRDVSAKKSKGSATWEARYTFTSTGRPVVNVGHATFRFKDDLIVEHRDEFDFPKWAGQALGFKGKLLGRTGFLRGKVQANAMAGLRNYQAGRGTN